MFCRNCGKEIPEGGVCSCGGGVQQPVAQPAPQPVPQEAPVSENDIGKQFADAAKDMGKTTKKILGNLTYDGMNLYSAAIFGVIGLICYLVGTICCFSGLLGDFAESYDGIIGKGALVGIVCYLVSLVFTVFLPLGMEKLRNVQGATLEKALSRGISVSILPAILFLLGGVSMFIWKEILGFALLSIALILGTIGYYRVFLAAMKKKNTAGAQFLAALLIFLAGTVTCWLIGLLLGEDFGKELGFLELIAQFAIFINM